jgi:membrane fusion protein (multidrug efflux system)
LALIVVSAALVAGGVWLGETAADPERLPLTAEDAVLREIETIALARVAHPVRASFSGVLEPRRSVRLYAETRGPVIEVGAEDLDRVEAGRLLVKIDPLLAEVEAERTDAAVARSESELALAQSNLVRQRSLVKRSATSDSDLDDAVSAHKVAVARLREARAEALLARDDLEKKTIRAPFAGALRSFTVEVGEYLTGGQEFGELLDLETARLRIAVSDREVVAIEAGKRVEVEIEAYAGETFLGRILRVGSAWDLKTRKFPVEIEVIGGERRLLPGMVVRAHLVMGRGEPSMRIPREATIEAFGTRYVYVLEPAERGGMVARQRIVVVRPIPFLPAEFQVLSGLADGETLAVSNIRQIRDGETVRPVARPSRFEPPAAVAAQLDRGGPVP